MHEFSEVGMGQNLGIFLGLNLALALSSLRLSARLTDNESTAKSLCAFLLLFQAQVTAITLLTGWLGCINNSAFGVLSLVFLANSLLLVPPRPGDMWGLAPFCKVLSLPGYFGKTAWALVAFLVALTSLLLVLSLHTTPHAYDALTYHLFFPARWLQEGALFIVPTPFGDPAPAYAPSNMELFSLWLMAPFGTDAASRTGQFFHLILLAVSMAGIGRRVGFSAPTCIVAVFGFCLNPLVLTQAASPEVDLAMAALMLSAILFLFEYAKNPSGENALLFGIASGLFLGTKYVSATYFPAIIAIGIAIFLFSDKKERTLYQWLSHLGIWLLTTTAFGGFWYLRNWMQFGSPIFPAGLSLFGWELFAGPITRPAMLRSVFHIHEARWLPVVASYGLGTLWALPLAILWIKSGVVVFAEKREWKKVLLWLTAPVLFTIWALLIPYNTQYRFLLPAAALLWLSTGLLWEKTGAVRIAAATVVGALAVWSLFLNLPGLHLGKIDFPNVATVAPGALLWLAAAFGFSLALFIITERKGQMSAGVILCAFLICAGSFQATWPRLMEHIGGMPLRVGLSAPSDRPNDAWSFLEQNSFDETIAYAGTNAPYPLLGKTFANRALYINTDGRVGARLDHYFKTLRAAGETPPPSDKPAFYRTEENEEAWNTALDTLDAKVLFVQSMGPDERRRIAHDEQGFSVERKWAKQNTDRFHLVFQSKAVEIYRINR